MPQTVTDGSETEGEPTPERRGDESRSVRGSSVDDDVLGADVETHLSKGPQGHGVRLILSAHQDEVEMANSDVVRVDVNLFHDSNWLSEAFELDPRSGRRTLNSMRTPNIPSATTTHGGSVAQIRAPGADARP